MRFIGWDYMTDDEKSRTFKVAQQSIGTSAGITSMSTAVMRNVPYVGKRQCHVLPDCPLLS